MLYSYGFCGVLICLVVLTNAIDLDVGDACTITRTDQPGICKFLTECVEAQNDLNFRATLPTPCGVIEGDTVVCCPIMEPVVDETDENLPIAIRKCKDYSRYVFINTSIPVDESTAINKSFDKCGKSYTPLIVGGEPAAAREFPHSALLGYTMPNGQISWDCGGSLVSTRYVLTAGHCLKSPLYKTQVSHVRLGELVLNNSTDDATEVDIPVEQIIPHPEYLREKRYNDIALLKLSRKVQLSPYILPICLPTLDSDPPKSIATGWGTIEFTGAKSNALLKVVLESYTNTECRNLFLHNQNQKLDQGIIETQLCAGSRTERKDTCLGDSGGPLQIYHPNIYCVYLQVGITSFGLGCALKFPGVYTRVYNYVPWIKSVIWAPGEDE